MMDADEVRLFIEGRNVYIFEPESKAYHGVVHYGLDGRCAARFSDGATDVGVFGFDANRYWTRYDRFRGGQTHAFHLESLGPGIAQAYFADGKRAFIQAHGKDISGLADD